ncbi:MAG: hypothetical protein ABIS35_11055 [Terracoccus sp.]
MTATARPLRAPRRGPVSAPLRVMPARITNTGHGAFAGICVVLLTVGLIGLLLLNTALAHGSLVLGQLQRESRLLSDSSGNLRESIDQASSSGTLARTASSLGMVRANERAYIDLSTGTVTGEAQPATTNNALPIVISATPPVETTAKVSGVLSSATQAATKAEKAAQAAAAAATPKTAGAAAGGAGAATLGSSSTSPKATSGTSGTSVSPQTPATR